MSLITLIKHQLRAWKIARLEQDIDWARASSNDHISKLELELSALLAEHDPRSTQDVAREMGLREKLAL